MSHGVPGTVLVVEDNVVNQRVAQLMLEQLGYQVSVASSGDQAVQMVRVNHYSAVLMDCHMPGMDGYEATRQIRRRHPDNDLPIIAFTANALTEDRERCLAAGMSDYLSKPVRPAELDTMLQRWIRSSEIAS